MDPDDKRMFEEQLHISSKGFDNIVFVVGTGTTAVSITFLTGLQTNYMIRPDLLIGAWILFGLSIVIHALSYQLSRRHAQKVLDGEEQGEDYEWGSVELIDDWITITEWTAFSLVSVGMIFLITFASTNFLASNEANKFKTEPAPSATSTTDSP